MPSSFTWLDTSERDRRRALDVVDLFSHGDTVDELGIAGIRDALSDVLGPGTSTMQTHTRCFLFVPWMYLLPESKRSLDGLEAVSHTLRDSAAWRCRTKKRSTAPFLTSYRDPSRAAGT